MRSKFHVGINIFVVKNDKLLLGKRGSVYGAGTWGLPGGHLEYGESMKKAAARELKEETGLKANKFTFVNIINDLHNGQHYLEVGFLAEDIANNNPTLKEPENCVEWRYFDLNSLPEEIFIPHFKQIQAFRESSYFLE